MVYSDYFYHCLTGNSSRECLPGGIWAAPNVSNCSSRVFTSVQVRVSYIHTFFSHVVTEDSYPSLISRVSHLYVYNSSIFL